MKFVQVGVFYVLWFYFSYLLYFRFYYLPEKVIRNTGTGDCITGTRITETCLKFKVKTNACHPQLTRRFPKKRFLHNKHYSLLFSGIQSFQQHLFGKHLEMMFFQDFCRQRMLIDRMHTFKTIIVLQFSTVLDRQFVQIHVFTDVCHKFFV